VFILSVAENHKTAIIGAEKNTGILTGGKATGGWRKMHNEYRNLKFSPYMKVILKVMSNILFIN
jgi:hypothetical protein